MTNSTRFVIKLTTTYLLISALNCADLPSRIASINPQIPAVQSQPVLPLNSIDFPVKVSEGTEINPNYNGNLWKPEDFPIFKRETEVNQAKDSANSLSWFPDLKGTQKDDAVKENSEVTHSFGDYNSITSKSSPSNNVADLTPAEKLKKDLEKINWRYFYSSEVEKQREFALISLAFELLNLRSKATAAVPLNILHIGTGSGYLPLAMAILDPNEDSFIVSVAETDQIRDRAKKNVVDEGKGTNLFASGKLKFETVFSLTTSPLPSSPNGRPFDLIILSKAVEKSAPLPTNIKEALSARGMIIYPERDAATGKRRIMLDRLNSSGNLTNIKSIDQ